jgi:hypothetical protein
MSITNLIIHLFYKNETVCINDIKTRFEYTTDDTIIVFCYYENKLITFNSY